VQKFLHNQGKGLRIEKKVIHLSKIFVWFEDDCKRHGGVPAFKRHSSDFARVKD